MFSNRSFWGWGYTDKSLGAAQKQNLKAMLGMRLGKFDVSPLEPLPLTAVNLPASRISPPSELSAIFDQSPFERTLHSYGRSFRDVVRAASGDFSNPPDAVALPKNEEDIVRVLNWCASKGYAVIPFGGGSSVTGGVEPPPRDKWPGVVSLDLRHLGSLMEVDRTSRAARFQAGIYGPALEAGLKSYGLTLRHFPQSFEFSTLGGWIATRSGGHYATVHTHIEDFVESVRMVTPAGVLETRRLPASGAGPSPERFIAGSEGTLGVITEAWMRVIDPPKFRTNCSVKFATYEKAVDCIRTLAQSGLEPVNCRLLDPNEAMVSGAGMGPESILLLAFEEAHFSPEPLMKAGLEICRSYDGKIPPDADKVKTGGDREGAAGAWRRTFLDGPYLRDGLVTLGMITETFETAVTWDRFSEFHAGVKGAVEAAVKKVAGTGLVSCRFTHVYPDGVAPYYTVIAPGKAGSQISQWTEIKEAAGEAILKYGGTITHHHAVGRDHRPWFDRERVPLFDQMLKAAKGAVDPKGILNPGVLFG